MSSAPPDPATHALSGAPARFPGGLRELGPRTWAWLQPDGGLGESNAGLVVGDGASLLVDTLWDERLTRRMLAATAPALAGAPLRRAFVTHPDGDHWWGNAALDETATGPASGGLGAAPVEILATPACDRAMRAEAPPRVLNGMTRAAALARRAPGRIGATAARMHAQLAPFAWRGVRLRFADRVLELTERTTLGGRSVASATLDVGGRTVRVLDLGPAHSPADAVVHVPDARLVFAADLLFAGVTPIMWHGPVETWLAALDALLALDAEVYLPGHGPPCGRDEIERLAAYWRWLRDGVAEQHAAGRRGTDAARALLRSPGHRPFADWLAPERILVNVATIERKPGELSPPARARLLLAMNALGAEPAAG
ncbi:MAG TPA: MBL fold metallo-hydrolase [Conexibacter sp.]|nr:MBL fold metallo-hydrolase [Conexibacter sp.]